MRMSKRTFLFAGVYRLILFQSIVLNLNLFLLFLDNLFCCLNMSLRVFMLLRDWLRVTLHQQDGILRYWLLVYRL
jgi:hypothetical protein